MSNANANNTETTTNNEMASGMTGNTGGTGGPGGKSNQEMMSFEKLIEQASYETLVSATGGIGGVPESAEEVRKEYKFEDLVAKLKEEVPNIFQEETLIEKINEAFADFIDLFEKTNAMVASKAYAAGMYLNQLKVVRSIRNKKKTGWKTYVDNTFPQLKKTRRENMMNIASLPGVENHFTFGVERLAEFSRYYNDLDEKEQNLLGDDPIATILGKNEVDMTLPIEENRIKIDAVLAHYDLAKKKIVVPPSVLEKFFKAGLKIIADDRKHMVEIAKEDEEAPAQYLKDVIAEGGDRSELIGNPTFTEKVNSKILNYDSQMAKLHKLLEDGLKKNKLEGHVNVETMEKMVSTLQKMIQMYRSGQEA